MENFNFNVNRWVMRVAVDLIHLYKHKEKKEVIIERIIVWNTQAPILSFCLPFVIDI